MYKYPSTRTSFCRTVGSIRESRTIQVLKAVLPSSYQISFHNVSANGTDIKIFHESKSLAKFEIINEDFSSYIDKKRALSIRKNLRGVLYKGLICSHGNLTKEAKKILKNIPILRIGFQTLPKSFHAFYSKINKVYKRKIANEKSLKLLKNSILSFLFKIGFLKHMYVSNKKPSSSILSTYTSSPFTLCDGGSAIFPLEAEVHHKRSKKRRKRVYRYVDPKKSKREVSFRKRLQKKRFQWMKYDCPDCKDYRICEVRDDYTEIRKKLKKVYQLFLGVHFGDKGNLLTSTDKKLTIEILHKEIVRLWRKGEAIKEKMWKCLKGRNRVHIFGNQKGQKKIFFNEDVNIQ